MLRWLVPLVPMLQLAPLVPLVLQLVPLIPMLLQLVPLMLMPLQLVPLLITLPRCTCCSYCVQHPAVRYFAEQLSGELGHDPSVKTIANLVAQVNNHHQQQQQHGILLLSTARFAILLMHRA